MASLSLCSGMWLHAASLCCRRRYPWLSTVLSRGCVTANPQCIGGRTGKDTITTHRSSRYSWNLGVILSSKRRGNCSARLSCCNQSSNSQCCILCHGWRPSCWVWTGSRIGRRLQRYTWLALGFYTTAMLNIVVLALALWALPSDIDGAALGRETLNRLAREIDWFGCLLISAALALLSYELAVVSGSDAGRLIREPANLAILCISFALLPLFWLWMRHQTRNSRPALIPNAIWRNAPFTAVCITVFLVWGALNASEQLTALYLQEVRDFSPLTASLYFLPAPIAGAMMNAAIGLSLPFLRPWLAVPIGCLVSGIAPLLLATLCRLDGPSYWHAVFQAMALNPLGADLIYTIANLVVTSAFPTKTQALAGGVFQMLSQIGKSIGIASTSIIAQQVAASSQLANANEALLQGYKAGWWYNSGLGFVAVLVSFWGLRNVGKLGVKID
ncbi:uncharacterized protein TrAtP1_002741 [Trichoderma atroviride]|uniref:uncharacterized protein n=1 Tax=Hypocrea atroviridis TaxID=63577 RepID=UPI00332F1974|nr:hypothetical protein TrAtP1_002741 [Trichoderma atroviride]